MVALACAAIAPIAIAQPTENAAVSRPKFADRLVAAFDFEELDNPLPIPALWLRGQEDLRVPRVRPGFPIWNLAEFDSTRSHSGGRSIRLPTRGGSTSLLMRQGALPVLPGADYRVAGWVRTEGLQYARACIEVTLLDQSGRAIPGEVFRSPAILADEGWELLDVEVNNAKAAFLQIDLLLVQPEQQNAAPRRFDELVVLEDVSGAVWFDDVTVAQLPQIDIALNTPGNIIPEGTHPAISVFARDMTGEALVVQLRVLDIDGQLIDTAEFAFRGGRMSRDWEPMLPRLGWYRATVEISDGERTVGSDTLDFVWVPGRAEQKDSAGAVGGSPDQSRFGVIVEGHAPGMLSVLATATRNMGVGAVSLPAWWDTHTQGGSEAVDLLLPVVLAMRDNWQEVTLVLDRLPGNLADQFALSEEDVLAILEVPEEFWGPTMLPLMDRLGQIVQRWQAGRVDSEKLLTDPKAAERVARFEQELRRLVPEARLAMPWPVDMAPDTGLLGGAGRSLVLGMSELMPPESVEDAGRSWVVGEGRIHPTQVALRCLETSSFGYRYAAEDFARRAIEAWAAFGPEHDTPETLGGSIAVVDPWEWSRRGEGDLRVRPEAAVMRTLVSALSDRSGSSAVELAPGVRAMLLEPRVTAPAGRTAALAIWADGGEAPGSIDLLLGTGPVGIVDIFGNERVLEPMQSESLNIPFHRVPIGDAPIFIDGLDAKLVRFVSSLGLDPPLLEARNADHVHELVISNPWPIPVQGEIYIVEPGGFSNPSGEIDRSWRIAPRVVPFLIEAGETSRVPIAFTFSPFEESGPKALVMDIDLSAAEAYGLIRVRREIELGSPEVRLELSYRVGPGPAGPNVYIDADVINTSSEPLTCRVSISATGFPKDTASVTALAPGQTAKRLFVLENGAARLAGGVASVSVEVPDLRIRLNKTIRID